MPYSEKLRDISNNADEIISRLFLGNEQSSQDSKFLKSKGITAVFNCTPSVPNKHKTDGVLYVRLPLDDSLKNKDINLMSEWLPYVIEQLKVLHKDQKRKVLVHCHAGMQRSAIVVAAYLVDTKGMSPMEAIKYIIKRRPIAFHNGESLNFEDSLKKFYLNKKRFTPRHDKVPQKKVSSSKKPSSSSVSSKKNVKKSSKSKSTPISKPKSKTSSGSTSTRRIRIV